ncbi:MAG: hypothetical protein IJZ16_03695 [Clostridia bacterium]|nr:hypothetical protein [Clostridia bacterium]
MKSDKLIDAIGMIDDDLIVQADEKVQKNNLYFIKCLAAVAAVFLIVFAVVPFLKQDKPMVDNPSVEQTTHSDEQNSTEPNNPTEPSNTTEPSDPTNPTEPSSSSGEEPTTVTPTSPIIVPPTIDNPTNPVLLSLKLAKYPRMAQYPEDERNMLQVSAWERSKKERRAYYGTGQNLTSFFKKTYGEFLSNSGNLNKLYSPLNVYMALAMTAEITDGETRQQILDLIGADSIESLRQQANSVWNANYSDDGAVTSILASSLWLDEGITFNKKVINTLATNYYASSYQGTMGSDKVNKALQKWLNEQTGGMLNNQIGDIELEPETVIAIATTIFYQAKWGYEFSEAYTKESVFHSATGDITCDFMNQTDYDGVYYWGENFSAVSKDLEGSGKMWFILPDENVSVDKLLSDNQALSFMTSNGKWDNKKQLKVNLSVPKFDVSSSFDLKNGLKNLGVVNCFDYTKSDFSSLCEDYDEPMYVSKAQHGVRVAIDEEGVTATAYTVMFVPGASSPPEDEIDFVVDRPFIFVITSEDGLPLFTGVVNQP